MHNPNRPDKIRSSQRSLPISVDHLLQPSSALLTLRIRYRYVPSVAVEYLLHLRRRVSLSLQHILEYVSQNDLSRCTRRES